MLRNIDRSQTEPLAALVAVAAVAMGISIYAAYIGGVLPGSSENAVEQPTIESVWNAASDDGLYKAENDPLDAIEESDLPRGTKVYIEVTTVDENAKPVTVDRTMFDESGKQAAPGPDVPPEHGHNVSRPIPIQTRPGDVTAGTLRVVTW